MSACAGSVDDITSLTLERACSHVSQALPFRSEIAVAGCGFRTEAAEARGTGFPGPASRSEICEVTATERPTEFDRSASPASTGECGTWARRTAKGRGL